MVTSLDGATSVEGVSGALGGDADRAVFRAVRAMADVILVGAGTVRAERYGPVTLSDEASRARAAAGHSGDVAGLAIVSGRLDLDPDDRAFSGSGPVPIVFTTEAAANQRGTPFDGRADIIACGGDSVDLDAALSRLAQRGARTVVCEGGPHLVGQLVSRDLVDEWCLNIAGTVAGGPSSRVVHEAAGVHHDADLASILADDGFLATRWVRRR